MFRLTLPSPEMALSLSSSATEGDGDLDSRLDGVFAFWDGIPFDETMAGGMAPGRGGGRPGAGTTL